MEKKEESGSKQEGATSHTQSSKKGHKCDHRKNKIEEASLSNQTKLEKKLATNFHSTSALHLLFQSTKMVTISCDAHTKYFQTSVIKAYNCISYQDVSYHWSCFCFLKFPSFFPESSICINPLLLTTMTSLINYPCVQGGTERWRKQMGK